MPKYEDIYYSLKKYLLTNFHALEEDIDYFLGKYKHRVTKRNEILLQAGEICPCMYFVNTGCLRIYMLDAEGREATRFLVMDGRFGTAFPSFILQEPSLAYIQSIEPSDLLYINFTDFRELIDNFPGWESVYRKNLELDYIASIKRIESLITMDAKERYNRLLTNEPEIIRRLPSKIIADYLGISQETLSRLKSKR